MINKFLFVWRKKIALFAPKRLYSSGITLLEMVVVISILTLVSTIILINHQSFNSSIVLSSLAYDVALSIREAQVFGLSVRKETETTSFDAGYGVHFDAASDTTFILFEDTNVNYKYDSGENILQQFIIGRGASISNFCATPVTAPEKCISDGLTYLDVSFQRPDPEAYFKTNISFDDYKSARIVVMSVKGVTREVEVLATGQISVLPN